MHGLRPLLKKTFNIIPEFTFGIMLKVSLTLKVAKPGVIRQYVDSAFLTTPL